MIDVSTDAAWEDWGRRDPYFGVITDPQFRRAQLTSNAKEAFFASGTSHVNGVLATIRQHIDSHFSPSTVLDFGCGVGRVLVPFAEIAREVVGLDVSPSMLKEARANCDERQLKNVRLLVSDDSLSNVSGDFDLIHSCIVFQHIPVTRGRGIFAELIRLLSPTGVGAIQMTYSKTRFASHFGVAPLEVPDRQTPTSLVRNGDVDPEIQMNPYNMNEILFLLQSAGVQHFHVTFSDHGGELGVFLFFSKKRVD